MAEIEILPGIVIEDPRPRAATHPYTFFLPRAEELAALKPGDGIKAIFSQTEGNPDYSAERMWVLIEGVENGVVTGTLDNEPAGMDRIREGDPVRIPLSHAISPIFHKNNVHPRLPPRREYWDRCFVDDCVLQGRSHVDYLYREEPDMTREGDEFPDSGWRIRGTEEAVEEDRASEAKPHYVALGAVLNADDRWLHLIDREEGCAFQWDDEKCRFVELA